MSNPLRLPWEASKPGNHSCDGVTVFCRNPAGMLVTVMAVRFQGTVASMCAEPLAHAIISRVGTHDELCNYVQTLISELAQCGQTEENNVSIKKADAFLRKITAADTLKNIC